INGLPHRDVLDAVCEGIREEGATPRLMRVRRSADVAFIGHDGAGLSGSGIAVGLQSKGTAIIHRADLEPLDNLELFGMAPSLTLESYRQIGRNGRLEPREAHAALADGAILVDTRDSDDRRAEGVIPGSIHVPLSVLEWRADPASEAHDPRLGGLDRRLVIVCNDGFSSSLAAA